jgi:hypothetical protein
LRLICKSWNDFIQEKGHVLKDIFESTSPSEWTELLEKETKSFLDIFIQPEDQLSKNKVLCENIWTVYHCTLNEIPLWIIGKPGSSKSLAVNFVHRILVEKQRQDSRITLLPDVYFQIYMCPSMSHPETIMSQPSIYTPPERELTKRNDRNIYWFWKKLEMQTYLLIFP